MAKQLVRVGGNAIRKCAFCKYYYDPTNSVINPKRGMKDMWEYETGIRKPCTARNNMDMPSHNTCPKYVCKI